MDLLPTSIWGVALYVFALFPGIAFIFDHEGHRPVSKRSALRETATVVFVSAICAAVLGVVVAIVAAFWPEFRGTVGGRTGGNLTWALENRPVVTLFAIVTLVLATLLGRLMGSKWAFEKGLEKSTTRTTSSVLVLRRRRRPHHGWNDAPGATAGLPANRSSARAAPRALDTPGPRPPRTPAGTVDITWRDLRRRT
ncbi:DUF6338 family protein [Rathayibacter tanaceti]|uniref:Uncharacterized protein n=1 Tax=Rathayibacter tanaceti TaxID=1671680 RepID=A0AAE6RHY9_9MICO|nr:DUF6338 family protein [Rathayibacter tanaceti]QHC54512.1 hypothetical protein GSU10_01780 [Rathayibacter tanaceti]